MTPRNVAVVTVDGPVMQIGELAERIGLSLRTIRYYDEVGLVPPTARSEGGFRLYTESDYDRFAVIKRMKPLGFSLEEMAEVLSLLDAAATERSGGPARRAVTSRLSEFGDLARARIGELREQVASAEALAQIIDRAARGES